MKDFILYDIKSELNQSDIYSKLLVLFPDYDWRLGDSDSQGKYISGRDKNNIDIEIWLGDTPIGMTVCFRGVWENSNNREEEKQKIINLLEKKFIPYLGEKIKKSETV